MALPVTKARIATAKAFGLENVDIAALACREAGLPFFAACAVLQKETNGRSRFGKSDGPKAALSGYPGPVNKDTYDVFRWLVFDQGNQSNGVGPCQITSKGLLLDMEKQGLKPYDAHDNMLYGFRLLAGYYAKTRSWIEAGRAYNGRTSYGIDLDQKVKAWKTRLGIK